MQESYYSKLTDQLVEKKFAKMWTNMQESKWYIYGTKQHKNT